MLCRSSRGLQLLATRAVRDHRCRQRCQPLSQANSPWNTSWVRGLLGFVRHLIFFLILIDLFVVLIHFSSCTSATTFQCPVPPYVSAIPNPCPCAGRFPCNLDKQLSGNLPWANQSKPPTKQRCGTEGLQRSQRHDKRWASRGRNARGMHLGCITAGRRHWW